jgi:hypothetical protein
MGQIAPTLGLARKTSAEAKNGSEWRIATGEWFFFWRAVFPHCRKIFCSSKTALSTPHRFYGSPSQTPNEFGAHQFPSSTTGLSQWHEEFRPSSALKFGTGLKSLIAQVGDVRDG